MSEYDGWGYDLEKKQIELFDDGLSNPVATLTVQDLIDKIAEQKDFHNVMDALLEKSGWIKRTESGEKVIAGKK